MSNSSKYNFPTQSSKEKIEIHKKAFEEFAEKRRLKILDIQFPYKDNCSNRDLIYIVSKGPKKYIIVVEGKSDYFFIEQNFKNENVNIELFAYISDYIYNFDISFKDHYSKRIKPNNLIYESLRKKIFELYRARNNVESGIKLGYGLEKEENILHSEEDRAILSYYYKKRNLICFFNGIILNKFVKQCLSNKNDRCSLLLTPNSGDNGEWTTINFLIPFGLLKENKCLIDSFTL